MLSSSPSPTPLAAPFPAPDVDNAVAHLLTAELVADAARELTDPQRKGGELCRARLAHQLLALVADELQAAFVALGER